MTTLEPLVDRTVADRIAERIREAIHDGSYSPGTRLVERSVARELGVSHIPVREALARLADEGLVDRMPRRGARVAELTRQGWTRSRRCGSCSRAASRGAPRSG